MKTINGKLHMGINEDDMAFLTDWLMDDSPYELDSLGFGVYDGRAFLVDLSGDLDTGDVYRELMYLKEGLTYEDMISKGLETGVIAKHDNVYYAVYYATSEMWEKFKGELLE